MLLRNQVEWALHCCSVLASLAPDEHLATKTLAEFHGVPKEYLSKALQALARAKIIEGTLGPTGGYRLARAPDKISLLDIVDAIEGRKGSFDCTEIRGKNPCLTRTEKKFTDVCAIAKVMYRADEAWRQELRAVSLVDIGKAVAKALTPDQLTRTGEWLRSK